MKLSKRKLQCSKNELAGKSETIKVKDSVWEVGKKLITSAGKVLWDMAKVPVAIIRQNAQVRTIMDQAHAAEAAGNTQAAQQAIAEMVKLGNQTYGPIIAAYKESRYILTDPVARKIFEDAFAKLIENASAQQKADAIAGAVGGLLPATIIFIITKNPQAFKQVFGFVPKSFGKISALLERMTKTLKLLREERTFGGSTGSEAKNLVDEPVVSDDVPEDLRDEDGVVRKSKVRELDGFETKEGLQHPKGAKYFLTKENAKNFHGKPQPKVLPPGTKIYRVVGPDNRVNGRWWFYELPESKLLWRTKAAVKNVWNENGEYVVHTVGEDGLAVWDGAAASQDFKYEGYPDWFLQGGGKQIYVPQAKFEIPKTLKRYATNWSNTGDG